MFFFFLFHFYTQPNDNLLTCGTLGLFLGREKRALPYIGLDVLVYVKLNVWKLKGQDSHSFCFPLVQLYVTLLVRKLLSCPLAGLETYPSLFFFFFFFFLKSNEHVIINTSDDTDNQRAHARFAPEMFVSPLYRMSWAGSTLFICINEQHRQ